MSAPFVIPFNFCPSLVSVKTTSYTVPSGKYVKAYVECDSGGTFTIDGVLAVDTDAFLNVDSFSSVAGGLTYTAPAGYRAELNALASTASIIFTVNGNAGADFVSTGTGTESIPVISIGPSGSITGTSPNVYTKSITGVAIPSNATNRQAEFFLPSGTVLSGTGNWKVVIQEYNVIS